MVSGMQRRTGIFIWSLFSLHLATLTKLTCDVGTFSCNSSDACVPQNQNCDGKEDCSDGSDEWDCRDRHMDRFWDHLFRKAPGADRDEEPQNPNCTVTGVDPSCDCQGSSIFCYRSKMETIPLLKSKEYIDQLDLTGNHFPSLGRSHLKNITLVLYLVLDEVELETIQEETFFDSHHLITLQLDKNKLQTLPEKMFSRKNNLEILRVTYNRLESLPDNVFQHLVHLKELDLGNNLLESIPQPNVLKPLVNLERVLLNSNRIQTITQNSFPPLSSLETLSLANNFIVNVESGSFRQVPNVTDLFLSGNNLTELRDGIFSNLSRLLVLNLNENQLNQVDEDVFSSTVRLTSLNLKKNRLKKLGKTVLRPAEYLEYVYFDEFSLCSAALHVRVCEPKGDGISSLHHLLENPVLRSSVWVMSFLACVGNFLVLLGRFLVKEQNAVHSLYIKNLSFSDLLMGLYLLLIAAADWRFRGNYVHHEAEWRSSATCHFCGFLSTLSSESSVLILSLITWDRLVSITKPLTHLQPKISQAAVHLVALWMIALMIALMPLFGGSYFGMEFYTSNGVCLPLHIHDPYTEGWEYSAAMYIVLNSCALFFICYAYTRMLKVIKSSGIALRSTQERQDRVVAQRFAVIVTTDCLCWIPVILIKIVALGGVEIQEDLYAWLAIFVLPINSALNPILYTLTTKLFKQQISRLLYSCKKKEDTPAHDSNLSFSLGHTSKLIPNSRYTKTSPLHSHSSQRSHYNGYMGTAV